MRIRTITTGSGKRAVQVVTKVGQKLIIHKHLGSYKTDSEKEKLVTLAEEFIQKQTNQTSLFSDVPAVWSLDEVEIIGSRPLYLHQLLTQVYDHLGFVGDSLIRDLVITRVYQPTSKRETSEILADIFDRHYSLRTIYRHLKVAISKGLKEQYQQALIKYARDELHDSLRLVFYDVTTLAFASQVKTDLKNFGYSKDHRNQDTQVVVGLVVSQQGFPPYFDIFSGNTFEGNTFVQVVKGIQKLLNCPDLVVIADAGMLSLKNMNELDGENISFVVGARISSLPADQVVKLANLLNKHDGANTEVSHKKYRLLIDYSDKRAIKNLHDLNKQWERAEKAMTKPEAITRRFRFLKGSSRTSYSLNTKLKEKAELTAGIKGYLTNTRLDITTIITKYHDLWKVEKAFRITKSDLEARPIFLHLDETIKAHLTIVFAGLAIAKLLEIQTGFSIHQILKVTSRIFTHTIRNTKTGQITTMKTKLPDKAVTICGKLDKFYAPEC